MEKDLSLQLLLEKPFTMPGLLFKHYKALGLSDLQFLLLIHIRQFHQEGNDFPTPQDLVNRMTIDEQECTRQLKQLLTNRFIEIEEVKSREGKISESISIDPLFEKLHLLLNEEELKGQDEEKKAEEGRLFQRFEQEFARPLSPMEMEMVSMWLDEDRHQPYMIEAALRESVVSSRLNFRYIDRILFDWKKNGVKTVEQAKAHGEKVRSHHSSKNYSKQTEEKPKKRHPGYNWLEGDGE
ncbi:DnaD domain-containing protein [Salipaludibacillus aurantiacus]|uniref:DNA replication protein n=1 Tax=Salipaludibacillus aurantiacus TaxID=1601833 RepID=A0A1H9P6P4_9BACI|nr:DnaD domain-containing protein [Salipaludibacillus aurantiacus]SER43253.1 DNA replication protein [Salipaludibacillus aurantiacus]